MTQKPDNPQACDDEGCEHYFEPHGHPSLSDKVARVKERMKQAEPYREIWSNEFHVIDQQNAIIQKQREVLVMAREALGTCKSGVGFFSDQFWFDDDLVPDALTAIDNVMKGEGV